MAHHQCSLYSLVHICLVQNTGTRRTDINTRSARMQALSVVPTPIATNLTPADSNFDFESLKTEASSQLQHFKQNVSKKL